jgi:hypothetical protein
METFHCPHDSKYFPLGDAVESLDLVQRLTVVGYYLILPVLNLGDHSSNPDVCPFSVVHKEHTPN